MAKTQGKEFEAECGFSLKALSKTANLFYQNSNLPMPMCDHQVWSNGRGYLIEEKECHADKFSFSAITEKERTNLNGITKALCEGWVLIKWFGISKSRCFACLWSDWLALEQGFGYDPKAKRNKSGSGSFPLVPDDHRPSYFLELVRVDRKDCDGNSLGRHWDLSPLFSQEVPYA